MIVFLPIRFAVLPVSLIFLLLHLWVLEVFRTTVLLSHTLRIYLLFLLCLQYVFSLSLLLLLGVLLPLSV